jgi:hypothetical protein
MTEDEWLGSSDIRALTEFALPILSFRKAHLFACACCRRIWDLITDDACRAAVGFVEQYVEEWSAYSPEWFAIRETVDQTFHRSIGSYPECNADPAHYAVVATLWATRPVPDQAVFSTAYYVARALAFQQLNSAEQVADRRAFRDRAEEQHRSSLADMFRDVCGNPFRRVVIDRTLKTWKGGTIPDLAQAIYVQRAFDRLPIVADALQDAGCTDAAVLDHCRSGGEHVRGCWALDLLLGKK